MIKSFFVIVVIILFIFLYLHKDKEKILAEIKLDEGFIPSYENIINASDGYL